MEIELIEGRFYWVKITLDPDAEYDWENQWMPARYGGENKWFFLNLKGKSDWPVSVLSEICPP